MLCKAYLKADFLVVEVNDCDGAEALLIGF